jgi:hypothetical protein
MIAAFPMARLRSWTLAWVTTFVWCLALSASDGQAADISAILKQFPGYHVLTLQERDPSLKAYVAQHFPKANPRVAHPLRERLGFVGATTNLGWPILALLQGWAQADFRFRAV